MKDIRTITASDSLLKSLGNDEFYKALWQKYHERLSYEGLETVGAGTVDPHPSLLADATDYTFHCIVQKIKTK